MSQFKGSQLKLQVITIKALRHASFSLSRISIRTVGAERVSNKGDSKGASERTVETRISKKSDTTLTNTSLIVAFVKPMPT
jgi:hypothetical protein